MPISSIVIFNSPVEPLTRRKLIIVLLKVPKQWKTDQFRGLAYYYELHNREDVEDKSKRKKQTLIVAIMLSL